MTVSRIRPGDLRARTLFFQGVVQGLTHMIVVSGLPGFGLSGGPCPPRKHHEDEPPLDCPCLHANTRCSFLEPCLSSSPGDCSPALPPRASAPPSAFLSVPPAARRRSEDAAVGFADGIDYHFTMAPIDMHMSPGMASSTVNSLHLTKYMMRRLIFRFNNTLELPILGGVTSAGVRSPI